LPIQYNDKTRQAFLRAGSARVVLTVRQGWELAWTYFVNTGSITLPSPLPPHPYMTIAKQIAAYDSTNYPGIPPANPDGGGLIDDDTPQSGTTCKIDRSPSAASPLTTPVVIPVDDATGFAVGATAILDTWDSQFNPHSNIGPGGPGIGAQETQTITAVDTTSTQQTITVQGLQYSHFGRFPVVQSGAKGVLIGEWFEYTPMKHSGATPRNIACIASSPIIASFTNTYKVIYSFTAYPIWTNLYRLWPHVFAPSSSGGVASPRKAAIASNDEMTASKASAVSSAAFRNSDWAPGNCAAGSNESGRPIPIISTIPP
jgi:hypothetical protein